MATEKNLNQALEKALQAESSFRQWFVNKTKFKGIIPEHVWSRSNNPWCRVKLDLPNPETGETESVMRDGETDVLFVFVFKAEPERRLALHIENKLASGRFTAYQPEVYEARAKWWVRNRDYGNYGEWDTVLLAPSSFFSRNAESARKFGTFIPHEEIARFLPEFRQNKELPPNHALT
jgi:hypothetical protein